MCEKYSCAKAKYRRRKGSNESAESWIRQPGIWVYRSSKSVYHDMQGWRNYDTPSCVTAVKFLEIIYQTAYIYSFVKPSIFKRNQDIQC